MSFLVQENADFPRFHRRPMLLKDFLRDDAASYSSAKSDKPHIVLLRSWSKRAAATKISAVIRLLQFASVKSPSVFPRSFSRRLTRRSSNGGGNDDVFGDVSEVKVKVKDILRWRSFRDLAEDDSTPLSLPPSPDRTTTTTATATTTTSCSKRSSWCDSDFTADEEELPPWNGESEDFCWGGNAATLKNPKGDWTLDEYDQQSPVSVLDSPFRQVKAQQPAVSHVEAAADGDFSRDEFDDENVNSWTEGEVEESYEWGVKMKMETIVKEMEKGICWKKFGDEEEEMCKELEIRVLNDLLDDLVAHFLE